MVRFHNDMYGTTLSSKDFFSYTFCNVWGGTVAETQEKLAIFFSSKYFLVDLQPIENAFVVLKKLSESYEVHIVSIRGSFPGFPSA